MVNIIFIYHHKTGHNLTRDLANLIKTKNNKIKIIINKIKPRYFKEKNDEIILNILEFDGDNNLFIQGSPFLEIKDNNIKIVHFIRNAYQMCISSYLYHRQYPTPEKWVYTIDAEKHNKNILNYMIKDLDVTENDINEVIKLIGKIYNKEKSYYDNLRDLDEEQGLILEACRSIISNGAIAGGDILRMKFLNNKLKDKDIININMEKMNNISTIESEIKKLMEYIYDGKKNNELIFYKNEINFYNGLLFHMIKLIFLKQVFQLKL
tara:strand:+ start:437 stop:1231 length:795 start_codon:yes stop_codon:yes gene_type:complete